MHKIIKYVGAISIFTLAGCSQNMKTVLHDNFTDYTVGQSAPPLALPAGTKLPAKDSYYVIPEIPASDSSAKVVLYPPGSRLMPDSSA